MSLVSLFGNAKIWLFLEICKSYSQKMTFLSFFGNKKWCGDIIECVAHRHYHILSSPSSRGKESYIAVFAYFPQKHIFLISISLEA